VRPLIRTFAPPGSVILDPFCGSGTTCLVAQSEDYGYIGFDNGHVEESGELYAAIASRRLKEEAKYARGKAIRDREGV
jgi:site-specific DNA-methyltransferase (adenine-specific)